MISNFSLEASLSGSSFSNVNQTEDVIFFLHPEFLNIILLTTFIGQMYTGLEIEHPIYKTVFCNLCVTLISSLINTVIFPFIKNLRFSSLMNANNALCIVFHYSIWCILSILRITNVRITLSVVSKNIMLQKSTFVTSQIDMKIEPQMLNIL
jgi:hypothetical protein